MAKNNIDKVPRVLVNRVSEQAVFPSDFILSSAKTITIPPRWGKTKVPTDLRFIVPAGLFFQIAPIPDISQQSIEVLGEFVGPLTNALISVTMINESGSNIKLKAGDQIARLDILSKIAPEFVDVTTLLD